MSLQDKIDLYMTMWPMQEGSPDEHNPDAPDPVMILHLKAKAEVVQPLTECSENDNCSYAVLWGRAFATYMELREKKAAGFDQIKLINTGTGDEEVFTLP